MLRKLNVKHLVDLYVILFVVGIPLWVALPLFCEELYHFTPSVAIIYPFLVAASSDASATTVILCLFWIPMFFIALITSYVFARFLRKRKTYLPFIIVMGLDLLAMCGTCLFKLWHANYYGFPIMIAAFLVRLMYYIFTIRLYKKYVVQSRVS